MDSGIAILLAMVSDINGNPLEYGIERFVLK